LVVILILFVPVAIVFLVLFFVLVWLFSKKNIHS